MTDPTRRGGLWLRGAAIVAAVAAVLGALGFVAMRAFAPQPPVISADVVSFLSGSDAGYARATGPTALQFPRDFGPHPDYQTEWWYYTGNLATDAGKRFGFQLTFFRRALLAPAPGGEAGVASGPLGETTGLAPQALEPPEGQTGTASPRTLEPPEDQRGTAASDWSTSQLYLAHFAVTDVARDRHQSWERYERAAVGLAGAQAEPFRVWLDDWSATGTSTGAGAGAATATGTAAGAATATGTAAGAVTVTGAVATSGPSVVLEARAPGPAEATGIRLTLVPTKPLVLHGDRGYSRKGAEAGNASYYVSQTRLGASGAITSAGEAYAVHGTAWMDHEWSTSALGADRVGWDWFSLQLDDGSELMAFQLRAADGTTAPESAATFVAADGTATSLPGYAFTVTATDHWTSPTTGARYPAAWRIEVPSRAIDVTAKPLIADQEMDGAIRYWEGAVRIAGRHAGKLVAGFGYAELTGYASSGDGAILP